MDKKDQKIVIVTGAGSGIGRATAVRLAKDGYSIGLIGRRAVNLSDTEKIIRKINPNVTYRVADVRKKDQVFNAVKYINKILQGELVGVVAAAGIGGSNKFGKGDRWNDVVETNLYGTYFTFSSALDFMKKDNKPKQLIAISSLLAKIGVKNYTAYCASKSGILGLVRSLAISLADNQIRVNAICPGWVDTKMSNKSIKKSATLNHITYEEAKTKALSIVPLRRMSSPEEIAGLSSFLFSEDGMGFTGQSFDVSNGSWMS